MKRIRQWFLNTAVKWLPTEQIGAFILDRLLDQANNRDRAELALIVARRIGEAVMATIIALENLLSDKVTTFRVSVMRDSVEAAAVKAWSVGNVTPPEARHLKEPKDATTT